MTYIKLKILILMIFYWIKNHENILVYDISYKTLIGAKPVYIMFDKVDRFIRVHDGK